MRFRSATLPGRIPAVKVRRRSTVQNETVHAVQQIAGKLQHLLRGGGKFGRTGSGLLDQFAHFVHGANNGLGAGSLLFDCGVDLLSDFRETAGGFGDLRRANRLFIGGRANFLGEFVNFGHDVGDFVQRGAKIVAEAQALFDDARAALHVFDGLARFALNGLVGTVEAVGGLLHGLNAGVHFLAGTIGDIQKDFRRIGNTLNGRNHLVDGSRSFRDAGGLYLSVLDDVLHVDAHLVHGAGDFFDGRGSLNADLGRFIGSAG